MKESLVYTKFFRFAVKIVGLYKYLCKEQNEYVISKQILKSGTSIGANIKEAVQASSKRDFLMKVNISLKEASETDYWLQLLKETGYLDLKTYESMITDCNELNKILSSIVKTTKENLKSQGK